MQLIPSTSPKTIEQVDPGSLVFVTHHQEWGIRTIIGADEARVFLFSNFRHVTPNGLLVDLGHDYYVSPVLESCFRLAYPWEQEHPVRGVLGMFPEGNHPSNCIVVGLGGGAAPTIHIVDFQTGLTSERHDGQGEGIGFTSWKLGVRNEADEYDWIHSWPVQPA